MRAQLTKRLLLGLCLVPLLLFLGAATGETHALRQEAEGDGNCQSCHEEIYVEWEQSGHGQAATDRTFRQAWKAEGSPAECLTCHTTGVDGTEEEGVTCAACHNPVVTNHPDEIMPVHAGAEACGECHVDAYADWQNSAHGAEAMACVDCHNPHAASLTVTDAQALCRTCHNEESHFYSFTAHADEGLLCIDCHLRVTGSPMGEGHAQRLHTFTVDLASCTQCHGAEMHYPVQDAMLPPDEAPVAQASFKPPRADTSALAVLAEPANPFTYFLAAAVGLGLGIIFAPGLKEVYRRMKRND
jgi:predicted CXXCH cytochrome family protein